MVTPPQWKRPPVCARSSRLTERAEAVLSVLQRWKAVLASQVCGQLYRLPRSSQQATVPAFQFCGRLHRLPRSSHLGLHWPPRSAVAAGSWTCLQGLPLVSVPASQIYGGGSKVADNMYCPRYQILPTPTPNLSNRGILGVVFLTLTYLFCGSTSAVQANNSWSPDKVEYQWLVGH